MIDRGCPEANEKIKKNTAGILTAPAESSPGPCFQEMKLNQQLEDYLWG